VLPCSGQASQQGLGFTKRNKKRFEAQEMLMHLGTLAHNVLVCRRNSYRFVE
jgi:hypothetical protein